MKSRINYFLIVTISLLIHQHAWSAIITQTVSLSGQVASGSNVTDTEINVGGPVATFNQYSGNDLESFTISWALTYTATADLAQTSDGNGGLNIGGSTFVDSNSYGGDGAGDGGSAAEGETLSFTTSITLTNTFLASEAGINYNPALLQSVVGGGTFTTSFLLVGGDFVTLSLNGEFDTYSIDIDSGSEVSVTFTTVPEPSQVAVLFGIVALVFVVIRRK